MNSAHPQLTTTVDIFETAQWDTVHHAGTTYEALIVPEHARR